MKNNVIIINRPPSQSYLPCKCGGLVWSLVVENDDEEGDCIKEIVCVGCGAVFEFGDDGIEVDLQ